MTISVFDLFRIGIGPSSSHTVGPMRAARRFLQRCADAGTLGSVAAVRVHLYGSLAATGVGHGTISAVILGLAGAEPQTVDPDAIESILAGIDSSRTLHLLGHHEVTFDASADIVMHPDETLPGHPNGMLFEAFGGYGALLDSHRYYSVGGGFVVDDSELNTEIDTPVEVPYAYRSAEQLLAMCADTKRRRVSASA